MHLNLNISIALACTKSDGDSKLVRFVRDELNACIFFSIKNYLKHWLAACVKLMKIILGFNKLQCDCEASYEIMVCVSIDNFNLELSAQVDFSKSVIIA